MINRDGTESNGYLGSSDMVEDLMIKNKGKIADELARHMGICYYIMHRIKSNIYWGFYRRLIRYFKERNKI